MVFLCEICGERKAVYVCQKCGRRVCENCIDPLTLTCKNCSQTYQAKAYPSPLGFTFDLPTKLLILGIILTFVGFSLAFLSTFLGAGIPSAGGFVWIFPFPPIIFGSGFNNPLAWLTFTVLAFILVFLVLALIKTFKI
ncbi:MAG: hypothetical protein DRO36_03650 [Candidatus Hecatellales archaeon]|nr:MAG: hypothetical protein DRO36_03650 [Candidatus Hecatellales archaeon]